MLNNDKLNTLVEQVSKGNQVAFGLIFTEYSGKVYAYALKLTSSEILSEEAVQEVFTKIWVNRALLDSVENFPSYLFRMVRNHTLNVLKRLALESRIKDQAIMEIPKSGNGTEETVIYREYKEILERAIDRLPPQQQLVYKMCHGKEMRYEEVAKHLNISRFTVKTHMQQALRSIRGHFTAYINGFALVIIPLLN